MPLQCLPNHRFEGNCSISNHIAFISKIGINTKRKKLGDKKMDFMDISKMRITVRQFVGDIHKMECFTLDMRQRISFQMKN